MIRKIIIVSSLTLCTLFLAHCSPKATKAISETSSTKTSTGTDYTAEQLDAGKTIFIGNCARCHGLKTPESRTPEQWDKVLKRMIPKAKLNEEDGKLVKAYLLTNAKKVK